MYELEHFEDRPFFIYGPVGTRAYTQPFFWKQLKLGQLGSIKGVYEYGHFDIG